MGVFDKVVGFGKAIAGAIVADSREVVYQVLGLPGFTEGQTAVNQPGFSGLGLIGNPLPPEKIGGIQYATDVVFLHQGDQLVPIAWRDLRLNQVLPNPKPGDLALVGYGANFAKLSRDGSISIVTTDDGTNDGKMIYLQVLPTGFQLVGPFGKITYGTDGFHLLHHTGARIDLGGIGGLPAPLDSLGSYVSLSAAMAKIEASTITLGPAGGAAEPAAKALALQTVLGTVSSVFVSMQPLLVKIGAALSTLDPSVAGDVTAINGLIAASVTAIGAGAVAIPSQSTTVT